MKKTIRTKEDQMLHPWSWKCHADVKPLSINIAYYKNRNKSAKYRQYEEAWYDYLVGNEIPEDLGDMKDLRFKVTCHWGFSSRASDVDNPIKPTVDILQKHFGFNDKQILHIEAFKHITTRGNEYAYVKIEQVFEEDYPAYNKEEMINGSK